MKIALIGASGFIGSAIRSEALARGHQVLALVSNPAKLTAEPGLTVQAVDVFDTQALTAALAGVDLVISAFSGHKDADVAGYYRRGFDSILTALKAADVARLLVVGGAASLQLPDGSTLIDSPNFPAEYRGSAEGAIYALQQLKAETALSWSFLSPAAEIFPGEKTGQFRLGKDQLVMDAAGHSRISNGDYAVAMLDEAEQSAHLNQRFTLAY
ncbi:NAD(P)-dependent oxidoreductase [Rheinheimera marina]|uniref:NAD(P)-dependent oxidoreductase n=1 Tax=Rheinheimera marina TaxID=1774958 RepID=A0ABV9JQR7_9GAMM